MAALTVGTGLQYSTMSAAVAASRDGDTIYVQAGTYLNDFVTINTKISIVGVGGMAHFTADQKAANGKALFVTTTDVSFDHIEFSKAAVTDRNGAGIRYQGGQLTVTNSYFHDNQNGILGSAVPGGKITIDNSEFARNGYGDGLSHNIYVSQIDNLTVTDSYFHDAVVGHEIKSRAAVTVIDHNRIFNLSGTASFNIDLPSSGVGIITNNTIHKGANASNTKIVSYGAEQTHPQWANSSLLVQNNKIINNLATNPVFVRNGSTAGVVSQILDNTYFGLKPAQLAVGPNFQQGNKPLTGATPILDTSSPVATSPWDAVVFSGYSNLLYGTAKNELYVGGPGDDVFVISPGGGSDTIADFRPGAGPDIVKLLDYGFTSFAGVQAAMRDIGADVAIELGDGARLTIKNTEIAQFAANDFEFTGSLVQPYDPFSPAVVPRPAPYTLPVSAKFTASLLGDDGPNVLLGTMAHERLTGGRGNDTTIGGPGDDTHVLQSLLDVVMENPNEGIDSVESILSFTLPDNVENFKALGKHLTITGNGLNNILKGFSGNDIIDGKAGNDILHAGAGADRLTGGAGNDLFVFSAADARDIIVDFQIGNDLIDLSFLLPATPDPVGDGYLKIVAFGEGSKILVDPLLTGAMAELVEVQGVAPSKLFVGYDVIW
jgi:Ca2+-binding RTX toxin-like protein